MAKRAGESMSTENDPKADLIRADIDKTRADLASTVDEIEHRLSPSHLKEQVADLKDTVVEQFHVAKEHIKKDLQGDFAEAKVKVKDEIEEVRTAAYDATVGKVHHMVDDARETVTDAGSSIIGTIRANPIPSALIALGVGWLAFNSRSNARFKAQRYAYASPYGGEELDLYAGYVGGDEARGARYDRTSGPRRVIEKGQRSVSDVGHRVAEGVDAARHLVSDKASEVAENARSVAHKVGDRASHLVDEARSTASHVARDARSTGRNLVRGAGEQYHRVEHTVEVAYGDSPLAFGAVALAVGAAVGIALPHTKREDAWMGSMKNRLLDQAQSAATDAIHRAEESVGQLGSPKEEEEPRRRSSDRRPSTRSYDRF